MRPPSRPLVIIADDFGIGPPTTAGILELASSGVLSGTVLMVNSPHAEQAVADWRRDGRPVELGWHPCLTQDGPVAPADSVRTLLGPDGCMWPLGKFLTRLTAGLVRADHLRAELEAQHARFIRLTGQAPALVNSHQHVALFGPVGAILRDILRRQPTPPFVRRVREPARSLVRVPGAWVKRLGLTALGRIQARAQVREGFPGAAWLAGVTDPAWVQRSDFFARWLSAMPGPSVELMVHPGHLDETLVGRDCKKADDGFMQRRVDELALLRRPDFPETCRRAGYRLMSVGRFVGCSRKGGARAA